MEENSWYKTAECRNFSCITSEENFNKREVCRVFSACAFPDVTNGCHKSCLLAGIGDTPYSSCVNNQSL